MHFLQLRMFIQIVKVNTRKLHFATTDIRKKCKLIILKWVAWYCLFL